MTSPARIFAAAVLTVGLAFPATSHASGLPDLRPAAQPASALALHAVDMLSAGPGMDPSGPGASGTSGPTGDNGPGLDPNGPKASHHQVGGPSAPRLLPIAN